MSVMIKEILKRQIIKNSLLNFISRSFVLIISVVFIAYISRKLTKFELGIFAVMNIFMGIIPLIVGLGLATSAIRLVPELKAKGNFEKVSDIIKLTVSLPIPETILITLLGVILSKFLSIVFLKSYQYSEYIIWIILISFFYSFFERIILVYQSLQDFKKIAFLSIFMNLLSRILAIIFLLNGYGIVGIFQGFLIGTILGVTVGIFTLRKYVFSRYYGYPIKEYVKFSFPYYLQGWAQFTFTQLDQFVVSLVFTPEVLAIFFIGKKIISSFILIFTALKEVINVKMAEIKGRGIENFKNNLSKIGRVLILIGNILTLFVIFNSKLLTVLLGSNLYSNYYYITILFAFYIFFFSIFAVLNTGIYIIETSREFLKISIHFGIVNLLVTVVVTVLLKLIGLSISQSLSSIYAIYYIFKRFQTKWIDISFKFIILNSLLVLFSGAIGIFLNLFLNPTICFTVSLIVILSIITILRQKITNILTEII